MKNKNPEISFVLSTLNKIPSINSIYKAKLSYKFGKPYPSIYKDSSATKITEEINEQLKMIDFEEKAPWIFDNNTTFNLTLQLILKQSLGKRDLDNTLKVIQDAIFRYLGLNDSRVVEIHAYKTILPKAPDEKICIRLSASDFETSFSKLTTFKKPQKIFLGGTQSEWRGDLEPLLKKEKISYFNPVVKNWKPEDKLIEDQEKEDSDCHLYYITPEQTGFYSFAEIINSSWEAQELDGYMFLGIQDTGWSESQKKSLQAIIDMVSSISSNNPKIRGSFMNDPKELMKFIKN